MRQPIPFGKYVLLERISVGGMAEVFKAKAFGVEGFEKILAIKRILPSMAEDADFIEMFIDEAKICGQLNHANICQIFELGRVSDSHFIAMEYVWGKDVLQIQNRFRKLRQTMKPEMAAFVAAKLCEGLDYAHKKKDPGGRPLGIIHRDISPQNILISYDGEVKVIDFGIAKAASRSSKTQAGVLKGKFGYMSPEQVRGLPLDRRSDVFSIGTILYELLTSDRLFMGESDFETLERVRNVDVPPITQVNPTVPPEIERIIMRALAKDVEDRYQWASEMQEELQAFLVAREPVFTPKQLSGWMREQFALEMKREQQILDEQRKIGKDVLLGSPAPPVLPELTPPPILDGNDLIEVPHNGVGDAATHILAGIQLDGDPPELEGERTTIQGFDGSGPMLTEQKTQIIGDGVAAAALVAAAGPRPAPKAGESVVQAHGAVELRAEPTVILDGTGSVLMPQSRSQVAPMPKADPGARTLLPTDVAELMAQAQAAMPLPPPPKPMPQFGTTEPTLPALDNGAMPGSSTVILGTGMSPLPPSGPQAVVNPGASVPTAVAEPELSPPRPPRPLTGPVAAPPPYATSGRASTLTKDIAIGVGVAIAVVFGVLGARAWFGKSRSTLVVMVSPARTADVIIDGAPRGHLEAGAPLTIKELTPGDHTVLVRASDGVEYQQTVALQASDVSVLTAPLPQAPPPKPETPPAGTPTAVAGGPSTGTPSAGGPSAGAPATGVLKLRVTTAGATVSVDGAQLADNAWKDPIPLRAEVAHDVRVAKPGFEEVRLSVTPHAGKPEERSVELLPAYAKVTVLTEPAGAEISVNGRRAGPSPITVGDVDPSKPARVSVRLHGYSTVTKYVSFDRGHEQTLDLKLASSSSSSSPSGSSSTSSSPSGSHSSKSGASPSAGADPGFLVANTQPWAKVLIDGKDTGKTTPIAPRSRIPLKPGAHTVTFVANNKRYDFSITIKPGEETRLIKQLGDAP